MAGVDHGLFVLVAQTGTAWSPRTWNVPLLLSVKPVCERNPLEQDATERADRPVQYLAYLSQ